MIQQGGYPHAKKMSLDPNVTPHSNTKSKWRIALNVRAKTIQFLGKKSKRKFS